MVGFAWSLPTTGSAGGGGGGGGTPMTLTRLVRLLGRGAPWLVGLIVGFAALRLASVVPGFSSIARFPFGAMLGLAAGWSLIAVGLLSRSRERGDREGPLRA